MKRAVTSRLSTQFLCITSNLNPLKYYGHWGAGVEVGCIAQSCSNFSTGWSRVSKCNDSGRVVHDQGNSRTMALPEVFPVQGKVPQDAQSMDGFSKSTRTIQSGQIGENVSKKDKMKFLVNTLSDLKDSKEAVYSALDAWVAWEQKFPLVSLKRALLALEKDEQWHRVIQVLKWMLSKGQGTTIGTYQQLIRALDKDRRAEEAHELWEKKIGHDLHSVPWSFCSLMVSIYYRNNMLERLVKLFKGLEAFDRKPPDTCIVQKVADAYEMLGLLDEKKRVLEKYNYLFMETHQSHGKRSRKDSHKKEKKGFTSSEKKNERTETMGAVGDTDELQLANNKFEEQNNNKEAETGLSSES